MPVVVLVLQNCLVQVTSLVLKTFNNGWAIVHGGENVLVYVEVVSLLKEVVAIYERSNKLQLNS